MPGPLFAVYFIIGIEISDRKFYKVKLGYIHSVRRREGNKERANNSE